MLSKEVNDVIAQAWP